VPHSEESPLQIVKTKKRIAIVGGAKSWVNAPFDNKEWEIWVIGNQVNQYDNKRVDLIFEIHNDFSNRPEGYSHWLTSFEFNMVVGEGFPHESDLIETFDFKKANEMMGGDHLTSTPSYMTAYALYSRPDVEEIGYWGVDMAVDDQEYFYEQPSLQRWIGFCRGRDITVTLPEGCPLGPPDYMEGVTANKPEPQPPYSEKDFLDLANEHKVCYDRCVKQIGELELNKAQHNGAKQIYEKLAQVGRATDAGQHFGSLLQTLRTLQNG